MWILAMNAFIADVTANPNDLAFRYGMLHLATSLGRPVAAPVGAYLFQTGGYVCVFSTSLCGTALGAAFLFWRIRSFKWNPPKKEGTISKSAFSFSHISDCINTTFKKREGPNRKYILICMVMILMNVFVYIGEMVMDYNYVRTRYGWQVAEYSVYSSVISGASLIGTYSVAYNITVLYYNFGLSCRSSHCHSYCCLHGNFGIFGDDIFVREFYFPIRHQRICRILLDVLLR